ncbi:MAG: DAK2 domain-containing protein [Gordonia sp. (in: high G+C Gram-positive bacteria)]
MTFERDLTPAINPALLRDWAATAVDGLERLRGEINALNVFPIPDSDTGSNMAYTMSAACEAAAALPAGADLASVARALADGAVGAARGNSGIILSQVLIGIADATEVAEPEAQSLAHFAVTGFGLAALAARRAVSDPREGTVLTLIGVAAKTAAAHTDSSPADLVRAIADECADALEHTTEQLPELASAGVVDAGARGFLVLLDALVEVVTGVAVRRRRYRGNQTYAGVAVAERPACDGPGDMDFEVMYLLDGAAGEQITQLRADLDDLGDAVVIVGDSSGGGERFTVHVHTCDPGAAIEAGLAAGHLSDIRVCCFALDAIRSQLATVEAPPRHKRAVVAVVYGAGAAELFTEAGASVVRADNGLTPDRLAEAIRATDSAHVVVMANGALPSQDLVGVTAALRSAQRSVVTLPTSSMAQCLAALAVHDPGEDADADAYAMAAAAAGARWGSLRRAETKMMTLAGTCEIGDVLGLIGSDVLVIAHEQRSAVTALVDLMLATGGELVTLLSGAAVDRSALDAVDEHLRRNHPGVELTVYETGQGDDLIQVGVE